MQTCSARILPSRTNTDDSARSWRAFIGRSCASPPRRRRRCCDTCTARNERFRPMPAAEEHPTDWYVLRGRERGGPYPYSFVREGAKGGLISRYDLVWRPGWEDWLDAGGVGGLFAASGIERDAQPLKPGGAPGLRPATANALPSIPANFVFETPP